MRVRNLSQSPSHPLLAKVPPVKQFELKPEKKNRKQTAKRQDNTTNVIPVIGYESNSESGGQSPKLVSGGKAILN